MAASLVLLSHCYVIVKGLDDFEPVYRVLHMTVGSICVDIFFITSGFLVTASLLSKQNVVDFIFARGLRIYPALIVMVLIVTLGVGLFFTTHERHSYLVDQRTWHFLYRNSVALFGVDPSLPGVFATNTLKSVVNGSLWTLTYELWMYTILCLFWIALRAAPNLRVIAFKVGIIICAMDGAFVHIVGTTINGHDNNYARFFFLFFTGASFYILRNLIPMHRGIFWSLLAIVVISAMKPNIFFIAYFLSLAYLLFYIAYIPRGAIRQFNRAGDYSYGIYIWAFPIQQAIVSLYPDTGIYRLMLVSFPITFVVAVLSWHFLERYALEMKNSCVVVWDGFTRQLKGRCGIKGA